MVNQPLSGIVASQFLPSPVAGSGWRVAGGDRSMARKPSRDLNGDVHRHASSTARNFNARSSTVNGFGRNATPGSSTPLWTTALRV
jgi:hypothetical protein